MASNLAPEKPGKEQRHQITPPSIFLPKGGGAICGIGEKFAANPVTCTGSMTVPIATSPGRSGFGTQLSFSYDSGSGKGPFGFGWSLSLPSNTRKTDKESPLYLDGQDQVPDSDVFILSGAEDLVPELEKVDADTQGETRWAVTDALTLLDTAIVTRRVILPLLDDRSARPTGIPQETWNSRAKWYERLAYLIGNIRTQEPATRDFLDHCLFEFSNAWTKARAVLSFGELFDRRHKKLFEEIALGDFSKIAVWNGLHEQDASYLRRMAVEALANIGDEKTLNRLRVQRIEWPHEVEKAFYWTSEEIF